jgi:DNA invertase Pin-like site-specific DNA recombinase
VAYYRVSTEHQDAGCAAQQKAVADWLNGGSHSVLGAFTEVETGRGADALNRRPELQKALAFCIGKVPPALMKASNSWGCWRTASSAALEKPL